ncbi:MAG: hypothetical protein R3D63_02805 [Paracoccaceae bacterium]
MMSDIAGSRSAEGGMMRVSIHAIALTLAAPALGRASLAGSAPSQRVWTMATPSAPAESIRGSKRRLFRPVSVQLRGFTCKSNVTECAQAHDKLLRTLVELVDDFNRASCTENGDRLDEIPAASRFASGLQEAQVVRDDSPSGGDMPIGNSHMFCLLTRRIDAAGGGAQFL